MTDKKNGSNGGDKSHDEMMDAIDELPLSIMPLSSSTLKKAKLLKNTRMESVLELYNDPITGSFQISTDDEGFSEAFSSNNEALKKDQEIIQKLSDLRSFDVYSLRVTLRKMGLTVVDENALSLSDDMKNRLKEYTRAFTTPLIQKIFGNEEGGLLDKGDLMSIFKNPDVSIVKKNLAILSEKTGIDMMELPNFLEEYSDVFLSVAYYRYSYEEINRDIDRLLIWIMDVKNRPDIKKTPGTYQACLDVEDALQMILFSLQERFARFQSSFELFWININRQSFKTLQQEIQKNHASMGAILCGLHVKLRTWREAFPDNNTGSPQKRAKFVMTDLQPGIKNLKLLEETARTGLGLSDISQNKAF